MSILRMKGVDWMDGRPIGHLYMGQKITMKIEGQFSEPGLVARELRRGAHSHPCESGHSHMGESVLVQCVHRRKN